MIEATDEIKEKLKELAFEASRPFCYGDYVTVKPDEKGQAFCPQCGSDDLMREVEGVGVEYGYEWVAEHLVKVDGELIDVEELFREILDEMYEPVKFGELEYSPATVLESVDPVAFCMGVSENVDSLIADGMLIGVDGGYYRMDGITD